ncbi:MAG: metal ABC transporter ATP-binding protein [Zestosphaera sp.]
MLDLTIGYAKPIVDGINAVFREKTLTQIIGANGSGKTTLIKTLVGILKPLKGSIFLYEEDVTGSPERIGRYVGYVPQIFTPSYFPYPVSVEELIESSYLLYRRKWPRTLSSSDVKKRVEEVLDLVELDKSVKNKSFWELSGGQRQRVLIARALIHEPKILILDEPFSSVDPAGRVSLASMMIKLLKSRSTTVIMSSHDPTLLLQHTDNLLLLGNGKWFFGSPEEILKENILKEVYGEAITTHEKHVHIHDYHV